MAKSIVQTDKAPRAIGPYSQGVMVEPGRLVFTAGQIPMDPASGQVIVGDIQAQTRRVIENLEGVLQAAETDLQHVIKTTVFLKDMNDFQVMNEVYAEYFNQDPPARSAVEVARLPKDVLIEMECVARIP